MPKHADETVADATATEPIITPDTPPVEASPTDPAPTPEADPVSGDEVQEYADDEESVIEPSPYSPAEKEHDSEGDKPIESIPMGSVEERAVTYASQIEDEDARGLILKALADQRVFSKDWDVRYRLETSNVIREMVRWIRTNIPSSASYKTFMEGINTYLLMVETQAIPSMWSKESASAPLDEIQARKAAMAIERSVEHLENFEGEPKEALLRYAQLVREGKIK